KRLRQLRFELGRRFLEYLQQSESGNRRPGVDRDIEQPRESKKRCCRIVAISTGDLAETETGANTCRQQVTRDPGMQNKSGDQTNEDDRGAGDDADDGAAACSHHLLTVKTDSTARA